MIDIIRLLLMWTHPGSLILVILLYSLGTGIADFLGTPVDASANLLGMAVSVFLVLGSQLLDLFFRTYPPETALPIQNSLSEKKPDLSLIGFRRLVLQLAISALTGAAFFTILLITQRRIEPASAFILAVMFLVSYIYSVPPLQLSRKSLGEVVEAVLITNLIPAFAFLLQTGVIHRLLLMLTIPLTALMLAMRLAMALPAYGRDVARERMNMMTGMGWQRGMRLHNVLILLAFFLLTLALLQGLPWSLYWPALLVMPVGLYEIFQIRQIASGIKPNWNILNLTSAALVGLTAYLITLSLWIG